MRHELFTTILEGLYDYEEREIEHEVEISYPAIFVDLVISKDLSTPNNDYYNIYCLVDGIIVDSVILERCEMHLESERAYLVDFTRDIEKYFLN